MKHALLSTKISYLGIPYCRLANLSSLRQVCEIPNLQRRISAESRGFLTAWWVVEDYADTPWAGSIKAFPKRYYWLSIAKRAMPPSWPLAIWQADHSGVSGGGQSHEMVSKDLICPHL